MAVRLAFGGLQSAGTADPIGLAARAGVRLALSAGDRATYSAATACTVRKTAHAAALKTSAVMITGSRPR